MMQAPTSGLEGLIAHSVRELESMSRENAQNHHHDEDPELERYAKYQKTGAGPTKSGLRHVQTEQRRRDRINEGFAALKALMPSQERVDKASFLSVTVDYIKHLQGILQQLVTMGAVNNLPEEAQWNIRVLLPRKTETSVAPLAVPIARAAAPAQAPVPTDPASATSYLLSMLMNQPHQVAAPAQQAHSGLDIAQLLQQAAFTQQLQAQQNQLLQALQMQHLLQAAKSTGMPVDNVPVLGTATFSNLGQVLPNNSMPQTSLMPPMTMGCNQAAPVVQPKVRKAGKVRRHTTAAKIAKPSAGADAAAVDMGRPAPPEVA